MNKLGISLWNWIEFFNNSHTKFFPTIKQIGYDIAEFGLDDFDFDPLWVKKEADACNLELSLCAVMRNGRDISNEDICIRKATKEYLKRCLETASILGVKTIGGAVYSGGGKSRMLTEDQRKAEWDLAVTELRSLSNTASDYGVTICIEPLNRYKTDMVNTVMQAKKMVDDIGENCFGVLFDTYQAGIEEKSIPDAIRLLGRKYLTRFHASENDRGCPGTGQTDWGGVFTALDEIGYREPVVVESFCVSPRDSIWHPTEQTQDILAQKAYQFLRENLARNYTR